MTERIDLRPRGDREAELLIHCARASVHGERAERMRAIAAGELNWARLLGLADRNGLRPLLHSHLSRWCAESVPAPTLAFLRDYFQKNSAFNLLLTGELLQLLAILEEHGIDAIPFKGPAIAVRFYGHVSRRQFCDIDILVREHDVWRAAELIESRGFQPQHEIPDDRRAAFVRQDYVQLYRRDGGRTLVELHWGIAPESFSVPFDATAMWRRLETMTLQGRTVRIPRAEDLLLMLCIHGSRHGWDKLEGISCLAELLRSTDDFDWDYTWRKAREMRCRRMLALTLLLVHGLFDVPLPPEAAALTATRALRTLAAGIVDDFLAVDAPQPTLARLASVHLKLKDSYGDRARYCARLAVTPSPNDWAAFKLPPRLSFAYPLVRGVRVTYKRLLQHEAAGD